MTRFIDELTVHYRNLMLLKVTPDSDLVAMLPEEKDLYNQQLEQYSLEMIMRCLDVLTGCLDDINRMKQTSQLRIMVEMVMLRLCTPKLDTDAKALSMRIDGLERRLNRGEFASAQAPAPTPQPERKATPVASVPEPQPKTETEPQIKPAPAPWEEAPVQTDFVDETGFAMPSQKVAENRPAADLAPWEEAPAQTDFVDETGFAMPPQKATENRPAADLAPWEEAPVQTDFVDETGFAMPPQKATENQPAAEPAPWEEAPAQTDFVDDTGFAMPPQKATENQPEPIKPQPAADKPKQQAAHGTKQPIAASGIKPSELEKEQPVAQWLEITDSLPPMMRVLLNNSRAYHHDGLIAIVAGTAARTILLDGAKADVLRDAVSGVLGEEIPLVLAAEEVVLKNKDEKLNQFLDRAARMGIPVKTKKSSK